MNPKIIMKSQFFKPAPPLFSSDAVRKKLRYGLGGACAWYDLSTGT